MSNQNWVSQIKNHRKKVYSQCGEEGFIEFILQNIGVDIPKMTLVEFGAGDGVSLSNSQYFIEKGSNGLRYDGNNKGNKSVIEVWFKRSEVEYLATTLNESEINTDLFLIDVDGNDYHFIDEFVSTSKVKPKLIVCEINPIWKRNEAAIIPYNEDHVWNNDDYYGMSLKAAEVLLEHHGYKLIFVNDSLNAYFVLSELLPDEFTTDYNYKVKKDHPHNKVGEWIVSKH
jgi:hypothetical protein